MISFLHTDHLLTLGLGTSNSQQIIWNREGDAFGENEANGPVELKLRFPRQYSDKETGHHYNYFRDYAPGLRRYVQSDPIGIDGGLNLFYYSWLNPLRFIDPFGMDGFEPLENFCVGKGCICKFFTVLSIFFLGLSLSWFYL